MVWLPLSCFYVVLLRVFAFVRGLASGEAEQPFGANAKVLHDAKSSRCGGSCGGGGEGQFFKSFHDFCAVSLHATVAEIASSTRRAIAKYAKR